MKKILFVSNRLNPNSKNGAFLVSDRNYTTLKNIVGEKNIDLYYIKSKNRIQLNLEQIFLNRLEKISKKDEKEILMIIKNQKIDIVFLDTSAYGYLSEKIKKHYPTIKIITFCHDINYFLYKSILKENNNFLKNLKNKKLIKSAEINEKKTFEFSDKIITLNERDSGLLEKKYNKKSTLQIPVSFKSFKGDKNIQIFENDKINLLFVGVAGFFPNIEGLEFFIKKVLPYINANLYIVGKNMENQKEKFESMNKKVHVVGTVDNLDEYYNSADAIIAPIFSGGGMKVKTGEALSYGKTIFGTKEAFEGYELDYEKVGGLCNSENDFIEKINDYIKRMNIQKINSYSKIIFLEKYSYIASEKKFKRLLDEC